VRADYALHSILEKPCDDITSLAACCYDATCRML
jgi:hypothetical protein